jgi:hypothetical protein
MTICLWLTLLAGLILPGVQDSSRTAPVPTVEQVLAVSRAARGGDAAAKVTSLRMAGSLELTNAGVSGTAEVLGKAPDRLLVRWVLPGLGALRSGFDGRAGWFETLLGGLTPVEGELLGSMKRRAEAMVGLSPGGSSARLALQGRETSGGRECWVVAANPPGARPEKWYFDVQSGLPCRLDGFGDDGLPLEIDFEDYRDVDGAKFPFTIRYFTPVYSVVMKFQSVGTNVPVDDSLFRRP